MLLSTPAPRRSAFNLRTRDATEVPMPGYACLHLPARAQQSQGPDVRRMSVDNAGSRSCVSGNVSSSADGIRSPARGTETSATHSDTENSSEEMSGMEGANSSL